MSEHNIQSAHLDLLGEKLVDDMRRRGLAPGDRYLTTEEVSRMLGIRKAVANRAMRHLAEQEVLVRRQRSGTFVGPRFVRPLCSRVQTVYVLLPKGHPVATKWSMSPFVQGILQEFADVNVQFCFVPERERVAYVRELLDGGRRSGQLAGVVPVSCSPEIYRFLGECGVPAVAYGSLYAMQPAIHSVDIDNREMGRLLMQYLIDRGHRRTVFLMMDERRPGDNDCYDGISEAAAAASLSHSALIPRLVPNDAEAFDAVAAELLSLPDRPTAVIARGGVFAERIRATADKLGLAVPDDLEIVLDNEGQIADQVDVSRYPRVEPKTSFVGIAAVIGRRLKQLADGEPLAPEHITIPVALHNPSIACEEPR